MYNYLARFFLLKKTVNTLLVKAIAYDASEK